MTSLSRLSEPVHGTTHPASSLASTSGAQKRAAPELTQEGKRAKGMNAAGGPGDQPHHSGSSTAASPVKPVGKSTLPHVSRPKRTAEVILVADDHEERNRWVSCLDIKRDTFVAWLFDTLATINRVKDPRDLEKLVVECHELGQSDDMEITRQSTYHDFRRFSRTLGHTLSQQKSKHSTLSLRIYAVRSYDAILDATIFQS